MSIYLKRYKKRDDYTPMLRKEYIYKEMAFYFYFEQEEESTTLFGLSDILLRDVFYISGNALYVADTLKSDFIDRLKISIAESNEA